MSDLVIATLNARYSHASFGLRYLLANMGDLRARTRLIEFEIKQDPGAIADRLLAESPQIVGLGVYIWNVGPMIQVVRALRERRPELVIVLGGPEVSFEIDQQEICAHANYVVTGEADVTFPDLCRQILGRARPPGAPLSAGPEVIQSQPVDLSTIALPYDLYTDEDIAHRVIYVEASRGCPFTCEFCLSSLDVPLRRVALDRLLPAFQRLLDRGVQVFKFVDRTFNLSIKYSLQILEFFLERYRPGLFLHFEMIPDRLPGELREIIAAFPRGAMQFEVGIQTFNPEVAERIRRRQDYAKSVDNLRWLLRETGSYIHADLIAGLPGESLESFAAGFDRLAGIGPQEIQVNLLKRLRGTPISRHDAAWRMVYAPTAPYEILENSELDRATLQRIKRFAKYWDLIVNSGRFQETAPRLWSTGAPFACFMAFTDWLYGELGRAHSIPLDRLAERLFTFLTQHLDHQPAALAPGLLRDYQRGARREVPVFLRPHLDGATAAADGPSHAPHALRRQARHFQPQADAD